MLFAWDEAMVRAFRLHDPLFFEAVTSNELTFTTSPSLSSDLPSSEISLEVLQWMEHSVSLATPSRPLPSIQRTSSEKTSNIIHEMNPPCVGPRTSLRGIHRPYINGKMGCTSEVLEYRIEVFNNLNINILH